MNYTLYNMGKEVLFVRLDAAVRPRMKAIVDAFCFRLGAAIAAFVELALLSTFPNQATLRSGQFLIFTIFIWVLVIFYISKLLRNKHDETQCPALPPSS